MSFVTTCKEPSSDNPNNGNSSILVTGVTLNQSTLTLNVGNTVILTQTVNPTNATNKNVSWTSSNNNIATVTNGTVTAIAVGTATIIVTTVDGGKTATCSVTVNPARNNGKLTINGLPSNGIYAVYVFSNGIDISTFPTIINAYSSGIYQAVGTSSTGNVFDLVGYNGTTTTIAWTGSGSLPVLLLNINGSTTETINPMYSWTTISFTNGDGTASFNNFTAVVHDSVDPNNPYNPIDPNNPDPKGKLTINNLPAVSSIAIVVYDYDGEITCMADISSVQATGLTKVLATASEMTPSSPISLQKFSSSTAFDGTGTYLVIIVVSSSSGMYAKQVTFINGCAELNYNTLGIFSELPSTNQNPTASDFDIDNLSQTVGSVSAVIITPKQGKSNGAITIYYNGSTTLPTAIGTYTVTFNVAGATGWNAASDLSAGVLTISSNEQTAVQPIISVQPNAETNPLTVTASVTDGGILTYQWYRNTSNSTNGATAIVGATDSSYTINDIGAYYYYVTVTNTIIDNGDGGVKTAERISNIVTVTQLVIPQWARSVIAGSGISEFNAVATDSSGNVYAAGYQRGTDSITYGAGVSAQGIDTYNNVVLVKYNSSGTAQWARTISAGSDYSEFKAVTVDSSGNIYAVGYQNGTGSYNYGGSSAQGIHRGKNVVLVKYNSSGTVLWVKTISTGSNVSNESVFNAVAVDSSGNVYAAGYQKGTDSITYGTGVSAQIAATTYYYNAVIVKYNSSGTAQWAKTVSTGSNESVFNAVTVDSSGNVYAAGYQYGTGSYNYGGSSAQGIYNGMNVVLVKYNSSGTAQWARTVSTGSEKSVFNAVTVDSSGNVYAAGYQIGSSTFTYGSGVSAQADSYSSIYVVLVKYNSNGAAQWVKTVNIGSGSEFNAVAVDSSGNVYAAGHQYGSSTFTYGTGVSAQGTNANYNIVLVKYKN